MSSKPGKNAWEGRLWVLLYLLAFFVLVKTMELQALYKEAVVSRNLCIDQSIREKWGRK